MLGYYPPEQIHPKEQTPPPQIRHPLQSTHQPSRHPPVADTPWEQTPPGSHTPSGADIPLPLGSTPPEQTPPGADTPPEMATVADGMHPTGMHSCFSIFFIMADADILFPSTLRKLETQTLGGLVIWNFSVWSMLTKWWPFFDLFYNGPWWYSISIDTRKTGDPNFEGVSILKFFHTIDIYKMAAIFAGLLEAAYSLNWGTQEIWGKSGGETLALLW